MFKSVCFRQTCVEVEVAATPEARKQGLMHRKHLGDTSGMLFVFDEVDIYPFWMKDTLLCLDIVWLSEGWEVVHIARKTRPMDLCLLVPDQPALYVLEVNAGVVDRLGVRLGDLLRVR